MTLAELPSAWRQRAEQLRPYAAPAAVAFDEAAAELERALRAALDEELTLEQAAEASGYTADWLGRMVRAGEIPNAGRRHAPRIRRRDVPKKAGHEPDHRTDATADPSFEQLRRTAAASRARGGR